MKGMDNNCWNNERNKCPDSHFDNQLQGNIKDSKPAKKASDKPAAKKATAKKTAEKKADAE